MTLNVCIYSFELLSKIIENKKVLANKFWNDGKHKQAEQIGLSIARIAEIRLKYIYQ